MSPGALECNPPWLLELHVQGLSPVWAVHTCLLWWGIYVVEGWVGFPLDWLWGLARLWHMTVLGHGPWLSCCLTQEWCTVVLQGLMGFSAGHVHCLSKVIEIVSKCHVPVPTLARQNEVTNIALTRVSIPGKVPVVACLSGRYFKINK